MTCIFSDYVKYVETFLYNFYKLVLQNNYEKKDVKPFIDKYIDVRYYNNILHRKEEQFISRLNKELNDVAKTLIDNNPEKKDDFKNVFALFSYIIYFDDCYKYSDIDSLLETMTSDNNITVRYNEELKKSIIELVKNFIDKKNSFNKLFNDKSFELSEKRLKKNLYKIDIKHHCNFSKLYSDYAIRKAYNSDVVVENKIYLMILLLVKKVLNEIIDLNYSNNYVISIPETLLSKNKKIVKYIKALDNEQIKNKIHLVFDYNTYKKNKTTINSLINDGFSVCLKVDETFDLEFDSFILFTYVFVSESYRYFDEIKDKISNTKVEFIVV